jgi:hypothetical protein
VLKAQRKKTYSNKEVKKITAAHRV